MAAGLVVQRLGSDMMYFFQEFNMRRDLWSLYVKTF